MVRKVVAAGEQFATNHQTTVLGMDMGSQDLDGRIWELIYMEASAINKAKSAMTATTTRVVASLHGSVATSVSGPIFVLQGSGAQVIIAPAIMLAIFTGQDNIYSVPDYSFGQDGKTWLHVVAHLGLGTTIGPLVSWIVGCLIMFATKKLVTKGKDTEAATSV
jgi:hypothetical protein